MFCSQCGSENPGGINFCKSCGQRFKTVAKIQPDTDGQDAYHLDPDLSSNVNDGSLNGDASTDFDQGSEDVEEYSHLGGNRKSFVWIGGIALLVFVGGLVWSFGWFDQRPPNPLSLPTGQCEISDSAADIGWIDMEAAAEKAASEINRPQTSEEEYYRYYPVALETRTDSQVSNLSGFLGKFGTKLKPGYCAYLFEIDCSQTGYEIGTVRRYMWAAQNQLQYEWATTPENQEMSRWCKWEMENPSGQTGSDR